MASKWKLPEALRVGQKNWPIRSAFEHGLNCMRVLESEELDSAEKADCVVRILFPDWQDIYADGLAEESIKEAFEFLNAGLEPKQNGTRDDTSEENKPIIFWEKDWSLMVAAINEHRDRDIRTEENLHWWTFYGYILGIDKESLYAQILSLRDKMRRGEKLNKMEVKYIEENPQYFDSISQLMDDADEYAEMLK